MRMKNKDEIALHDYFDNLLSPTERADFEEVLVEYIDLAIDLRKLKTLQRILRNLPTAFDPDEKIIENIIDSLNDVEGQFEEESEVEEEFEKEFKAESDFEIEEEVEEGSVEEIEEEFEEELVPSEPEIEPEIKKEKKKKKPPHKKSPPKKKPSKKKPPKKKPPQKRTVGRESRSLRAKTKFRLKRIFTFIILIVFVSIVGAGYYYYQKMDTTFPWKVNVISESSAPNANLLPNFLDEGEYLATYKNNFVRVIITNKGIIELTGESEIAIIDGTQSLSSILLKKGTLKFKPQLENVLFQLIYNDVKIQSRNSEFEITTSNNKISTLHILTKLVEVHLGDIITKIPYNHTFQILNNRHISIPIITNSSKKLSRLVNQFDIQQNDRTLKSILNLSTRKNAYTLLFILQKVTPTNRELIIEKLQQNFPLPDSITKIDILMLDNDALNSWWEEIYSTM